VVLAAPLTERSRGMMNAKRLALMKPDAYLINVGRGPLIDDPALVQALRTKTIAGAALDVFEDEPLSPSSPYWSLDNCIVTPHMAAISDRPWERHYNLFAENLVRFMTSKPLKGLVDKEKGY